MRYCSAPKPAELFKTMFDPSTYMSELVAPTAPDEDSHATHTKIFTSLKKRDGISTSSLINMVNRAWDRSRVLMVSQWDSRERLNDVY